MLVFAIGLLATFLLWQNARQQHVHDLKEEFDSVIREAELKIERRVSNSQNLLRGLQALYAASERVERNEFAAYAAALHLDQNHPGIQSLTFSSIVPAEEMERHLANIRKQGFPDYSIKPAGKRKFYAPVIHIAPFKGRNLRVFGLDNYATPERRAALEHARDSGKASLSGKLTLVQDDNSSQSGILMFLPVYRNNIAHDTPARRQASIVGWVAAAFRINNLISGLLDAHTQDFDIEIYDGNSTNADALLYDSDTVRDTQKSTAAFRHIRHIEVADRYWTLSFASTPSFDARLTTPEAGIVTVIGAVSSLILALCTWLLLRSRKRALHGAHLLQESMQQTEMASRAKNEFLANIGHELRTPMNAILGMTHLALADETESHKRSRLENIQFSGEHLLNTIDNILDYSGMEYGTPQPHPVDFTLHKLLNEIESFVIRKAAGKDVELSIDIAPGLARRRLHGDARGLEQVLLNYLDNAVKFTPKGRIVLRILQQEENDASFKLRFEVQDSGIGIDKEKQPQLYSPFWQADSSSTRKHEGIGLGLAICKKLIEKMKEGEFGVDSAPGSGSTFWFSARLDKARTRRSGQGAAATTGNYAHIKGAHILVAEDNVLSQTIIGGLLESAGAEVQRARNGKEALELLRQKTFDCVLMDVQMPEMDGMAATRAIRANPALADLPVIAVTAHASKENRRHCLDAGMNDFIGKPFTPASLYARLAYWLPPRHTPEAVRPVQLSIEAIPQDVQAHRTDDSEIIDLSTLSELIGDDRAKMREFANKFVELARGDMAQIEAALAHNDHETLSRLAHHHKAPAKMVGAQGFADLCQELSDLSKQAAAPAQISKAVAKMRPLLDRIEQRVRQELAY
jgi:signal transduction histidine kinase/DNA-binding response OmpR family regulator